MKIRLLLTVAGLAIGFALPAFAQEKNTLDSQIAQQRDLRGDVKALGKGDVLTTKELDKQIPPEIEADYKSWQFQATLLRFLFVLLGVSATVAALAVTTFTTELTAHGTTYLKLGTFVAALSIGLITAFDIGGKANAMRRAVREFTVASILYRENELTFDDLVTAYRHCEDIVGDVNYIPQRTDSEQKPKGPLAK